MVPVLSNEDHNSVIVVRSIWTIGAAKGTIDENTLSVHRIIISENTPLVLLPRGLEPRQRLFLDAIRLSAQFVHIAYGRLLVTLTECGHGGPEHQSKGVAAMLDAWSVIDWVHRLRNLVQGMPRYRARAPSKQVFLRATAVVEDLRHAIQHLETDIETLLKSGRPALGTLTWVVPVDSAQGMMRLQMFWPGQFEGASPGANILVPKVPDQIGQVELWASNYHANLSELSERVSKLIATLETSLTFVSDDGDRQRTPARADFPKGSADTWLTVLVLEGPDEESKRDG